MEYFSNNSRYDFVMIPFDLSHKVNEAIDFFKRNEGFISCELVTEDDEDERLVSLSKEKSLHILRLKYDIEVIGGYVVPSLEQYIIEVFKSELREYIDQDDQYKALIYNYVA